MELIGRTTVSYDCHSDGTSSSTDVCDIEKTTRMKIHGENHDECIAATKTATTSNHDNNLILNYIKNNSQIQFHVHVIN